MVEGEGNKKWKEQGNPEKVAWKKSKTTEGVVMLQRKVLASNLKATSLDL